jgi:hypothetical protein
MGYDISANGRIKVHVTPAQREDLLLLVNRRIEDLRFFAKASPDSPTAVRQQAELDRLTETKHELEQAGS